MADPATHRCGVEEIDYSLVGHGHLRCARERGGCGREWTFVAGRGWWPSSLPVGAPAVRGRTMMTDDEQEGDGPW